MGCCIFFQGFEDMDGAEKYAKLQCKHGILQDLTLQEVIDLDDDGFKMLLDEIGKDFQARSFLNKARASFTAGGMYHMCASHNRMVVCMVVCGVVYAMLCCDEPYVVVRLCEHFVLSQCNI